VSDLNIREFLASYLSTAMIIFGVVSSIPYGIRRGASYYGGLTIIDSKPGVISYSKFLVNFSLNWGCPV